MPKYINKDTGYYNVFDLKRIPDLPEVILNSK